MTHAQAPDQPQQETARQTITTRCYPEKLQPREENRSSYRSRSITNSKSSERKRERERERERIACIAYLRRCSRETIHSELEKLSKVYDGKTDNAVNKHEDEREVLLTEGERAED